MVKKSDEPYEPSEVVQYNTEIRNRLRELRMERVAAQATAEMKEYWKSDWEKGWSDLDTDTILKVIWLIERKLEPWRDNQKKYKSHEWRFVVQAVVCALENLKEHIHIAKWGVNMTFEEARAKNGAKACGDK